jgi:hypothetical protein
MGFDDDAAGFAILLQAVRQQSPTITARAELFMKSHCKSKNRRVEIFKRR